MLLAIQHPIDAGRFVAPKIGHSCIHLGIDVASALLVAKRSGDLPSRDTRGSWNVYHAFVPPVGERQNARSTMFAWRNLVGGRAVPNTLVADLRENQSVSQLDAGSALGGSADKSHARHQPNLMKNGSELALVKHEFHNFVRHALRFGVVTLIKVPARSAKKVHLLLQVLPFLGARCRHAFPWFGHSFAPLVIGEQIVYLT